MKYILICLLISGCAVTPKDVFQAKKECHHKGGYEKIDTFPSKHVLCKDGSYWSIGREPVKKPQFL